MLPNRLNLYSGKHWIYHTLITTFLPAFLCIPLFTLANETEAGSQNFSQPNLFYGNQSLNPMVRKNKTVVHLPGGAETAIQDDEITYHLTDHLRSTRLAIAEGGRNTVSRVADYIPFGGSVDNADAETTARYTSMAFEPETATYDYHARAYDPTIARFTSVDAIRESTSPYSYTENNPVNNVDPDGLGKEPVSSPFFSHETNIKIQSPRGLIAAIRTELGGYRRQHSTPLSVFEKSVVMDKITNQEVTKHAGALSNTRSLVKKHSKRFEVDLTNRFYVFIGEGDENVKTPEEIIEGMRKMSTFSSLKDKFAEEIVILDFSGKNRSAELSESLRGLKENQLVSVINLKAKYGRTGKINKVGKKEWGITAMAFEGGHFMKYEQKMLQRYVDTEVAAQRQRMSLQVPQPITEPGPSHSGHLPTQQHFTETHRPAAVYLSVIVEPSATKSGTAVSIPHPPSTY